MTDIKQQVQNVKGNWYMVDRPILLLSGERCIIELPLPVSTKDQTEDISPLTKRVFRITVNEFVPENQQPTTLNVQRERIQ